MTKSQHVVLKLQNQTLRIISSTIKSTKHFKEVRCLCPEDSRILQDRTSHTFNHREHIQVHTPTIITKVTGS